MTEPAKHTTPSAPPTGWVEIDHDAGEFSIGCERCFKKVDCPHDGSLSEHACNCGYRWRVAISAEPSMVLRADEIDDSPKSG